MRRFAICVALVAFSLSGSAQAANGNGPQAYRVKLTESAAAMPPLVYDPSLSIQQNNQRLADRDSREYLLVSVDVERDGLKLKSLTGRTVPMLIGGRPVAGHIVAFSATGQNTQTETVRLYIRVYNPKLSDGTRALAPGDTGFLSLER